MGVRICRNIYERICFDIFKLVSERGIRYTDIIKQMKVANKVFLDQSVLYLDLALGTWQYKCEIQMKFEIIKKLSLTCAEYLLAESEIPPNSSFEGIFGKVDLFLNKMVLGIERDRNNFLQSCYIKFSSIFFKRFENLNLIQKRSKCRSLLRIHRILKIRYFDDFTSKILILAVICPEIDLELTVDVLSDISHSDYLVLPSLLNLPYGALEKILSHAKSVGFVFRGLWRGVGDISTKLNLIAELVTSDRKLHAIILLQHGFPYLCSSNIYRSECLSFFFSSVRARVKFSLGGYARLLDKPNKERMMLILATFVTVYETMEKKPFYGDRVATLRCLMRSLPDPYVTPSEMCNELKPFFTPSSTELIESVCRKYQECDFFSEDYTVYKPRKLEDLCRCAIRKVLAAYWRLPEGIYQLGLPTNIIKYLSLNS